MKQNVHVKFHSEALLEELEARQLFSGGIEGILADNSEPEAAVHMEVSVEPELIESQESIAESTENLIRQELVFIDTDVENYQELLNDILNQSDEERNIEVILLDNQRDGIDQITETLANFQNLDAVHLISHGSDGSVDIGNSQLDYDSLTQNLSEISDWGSAFTQEGDFLIYGCNLAETEDGQSLVQALSSLSHTDVAASDDLTGQAELGGDWDLEYNSGSIETDVAVSTDTQQSYQGILATETVADQFNAVSYSNSDGTQVWTGDWVELADDNLAASGDIRVESNKLHIDDVLDGGAGGGSISRAFDLTGASTATLSFDYDGNGSGGIDTIGVEVSSDGGATWTTLENINVVGGVSGSKSYTLENFESLTNDMEIRFNIVTGFGGVGQYFNVDNVQINYETSVNQFIVSTTADSGAGSLRQAIIDANATANSGGADVIKFDIAGAGPHIISLSSVLPDITETVIINGSSEPDFASNPVLVIDGNGLNGDGLVLTSGASGSTISGLVIRDFTSNAIQINSGSDGNTITGNYLGQFNADGSDAGVGENIGAAVIYIQGANNTIGGTTAADRNIISGGANGVFIDGATATGNQVAGNYIGTNISGNSAIGNTFSGVRITGGATNNTIGGSTAAHGNVISGNGQDGIAIQTETSDGNTIQHNIIGITADGSSTLGNSGDGIVIYNGADSTLILDNHIAGNGFVGIELDGATSGTIIQGNTIGTDSTGTLDWGHQENAILIENGGFNNQIGGTSANQGNIIAFNGKGGTYTAGISILNTAGNGNVILSNSIYSNVGLGIDLGTTGVAANDAGDIDSGANNLQNYPVLTSSTTSDGDTTIVGTINTTASTTYRIELFSSPAGDGTGYGEAKTYLGFATVTTDGSGNATINKVLTGVEVSEGHQVTATATVDLGAGNYGDTSEFSLNVTAVNSSPIAHWTFDTDATDSSGNNYHGTLTNDAVIDTETATNLVDEGKLSLDGTDDHVDLSAHIPSLSTLTEGSISMWFNTTDTGFKPIFNVSDSSSPDDYASLMMENNGTLLFEVVSAGVTQYTVAYGTALNDGNWHHVSITVDGDGNKLYVDGVEILPDPVFQPGKIIYYGGSAANTEFFADINNVDTIEIGAFSTSFSSTDHFTGLIDDVQIHDYALTSAQVATIATVNDAPTFGILGDGIVTTDISGLSSSDAGTSTTVQPDGKILVGGYSYTGASYDFALTRYNSDGSLDTTFGGGDGIVTTPMGSGNDLARSITLQTDGKILVGGSSYNGANDDFALTRYNSDGSLDTTFGGGDGFVTTPVGIGIDQGESIALQADGKILIGGTSYAADTKVALIRYNIDGSLDTTFGGGDGIVATSVGTLFDNANSITLQADGKILVAGGSWSGSTDDFGITRYNIDGTLDTTFGGGDGKVTTAVGAGDEQIYSITVQADGKILAAGYSSNGTSYDFALTRYDSNGTLDNTFGGGDGKVTTSLGANTDEARSIAVLADGKILVGGNSADSNGDYAFALTRYNSNGDLDTTFGADNNGIVITDVATGYDEAGGLTLQADGKILLAGYARGPALDYDFALVRYNSDGTLDTSFDSLNSLNGSPTFIEDGAAVVLDAGVNLIDTNLDGFNGGLGDYSGASLTLVRNTGATTEDVFSFNDANGITLVGNNLIKNAQIIASFDTTTPGQLVISFTNANGETPTSADVDNILHQITYANSSDAPPASAQIDWAFNDGNSGTQGAGGALAATGSTTITITAVNDVPVASANTVNTNEDTAYTFVAGDFTFSDVESDALLSVTISNLNLSGGSLTHSGGITVTNGTTLSTAGIATLVYTPANNASGAPLATFDFTVNDVGAGIVSAQMDINVSAVNDAPTDIALGMTGTTETLVNTIASEGQEFPQVSSLTDGGYVVVWEGGAFGDREIFAQRYDINGNTVGSEFQVNTATANSQTRPSVAGTADGGFVITWESYDIDSSAGVYAQAYDSNSNTVGSEFQVATTIVDRQIDSQIAAFNGGGYVISWTSDNQDGSGEGVYAQRFDALHNKVGPETIVNTHIANDQGKSQITTFADDSYLIVWESWDQDGQYNGVYGQRFNSDGSSNGSEFLINTTTAGSQFQQQISTLSNDGFVVTWHDSSGEVFAQLFDSNNNKLGGEIAVNTTLSNVQNYPSVTSLADGGFLIAWESDQQDGDLDGIYAQRFDAKGNKIAAEFQISDTSAGSQQLNQMTTLQDGRVVVVWESPDAQFDGIYSKILSFSFVNENAANGTVVDTVTVTDPDIGDTHTFSITADSSGGAFQINAITGEVTVANGFLLNFEAASSHSITVQVTDSGGLTYIEVLNIAIADINEAPTAANNTVTTNEDTPYTFSATDFNFSDVDGDTLASITVTSLETTGTLQLSGVDVTLDQVITKADIDAGKLKFIPIADANGVGYDNFSFSVSDGQSSITILAGEPNPYTLNGGSLASTDQILTDTDNFGPSGIHTTSITIAPTSTTIDAAYLSQGQVLFNGYVPDANWTAGELAALDTWVQAGGILISNSDDANYDEVSSFYGLTIGGTASTTWYVDDATSPVMNGPFGLVGNNGAPFTASGSISYFDRANLAASDQVIAVDSVSGEPTIVLRQQGSGYILFTSDEGIFRANMTGGGTISTANDILAANILLGLRIKQPPLPTA